jgi:SAM-dependent methyltransferase
MKWNGIRQKIGGLVSGASSTQNSDFLNFIGTRQLLTTPQSEQLFTATDIIFNKLDSDDIESLEKLLAEMSDSRFKIPDFPPEHCKQEILRLGNYFLPQVFNKKTGLTSKVPPLHVPDLSNPIGFHCGTLYYGDLVIEAMLRCDRSIEKNKNYLDFGCSSGRVVRVLKAAYPESNWLGCDPVMEAIEWAKENLPGIDFFNSLQIPPLPYDDNQFSMVFAISIWSHFSEKAAIAWFKEINRIIEPGGLLIFSTHGLNSLQFHYQHHLKPETDIERAGEVLLETGFCYEDVFKPGNTNGLDCSDWGNCYILPEWILRNLLGDWKLLLYQVGRAELNQDVYVLEKK